MVRNGLGGKNSKKIEAFRRKFGIGQAYDDIPMLAQIHEAAKALVGIGEKIAFTEAERDFTLLMALWLAGKQNELFQDEDK